MKETMKTLPIEPLLTKRDVQQILKISRTHLEHLMAAGRLEYVDVSTPGSKKRRVRFRLSYIQKFIGEI